MMYACPDLTASILAVIGRLGPQESSMVHLTLDRYTDYGIFICNAKKNSDPLLFLQFTDKKFAPCDDEGVECIFNQRHPAAN